MHFLQFLIHYKYKDLRSSFDTKGLNYCDESDSWYETKGLNYHDESDSSFDAKGLNSFKRKMEVSYRFV